MSLVRRVTKRDQSERKNLREWVATILDVEVAELGVEAKDSAIDALTEVIECRAKEIAGDGPRWHAAWEAVSAQLQKALEQIAALTRDFNETHAAWNRENELRRDVEELYLQLVAASDSQGERVEPKSTLATLPDATHPLTCDCPQCAPDGV